jgi:FAD/FMN-containing dehydrogenase
VLQQQAQLLPYAAIVAPHDATHSGGQADPLFSNGFAVHLTPELNEGIAAGLHDAFPGPTLTRLRELKAVYDPQNVFNQNFPIDSIS